MRQIRFLFSEFYSRYRELEAVERPSLSRREREVLALIVKDKSNAEIASHLGVSISTVETYVKRCFVKLDVNSRTQAALQFLGGLVLDSAPS